MASSVIGQDEPNPALGLATRELGQDGKILPLGITCYFPQVDSVLIPCNKSFIGQPCSVKVVGYQPRSFLSVSVQNTQN